MGLIQPLIEYLAIGTLDQYVGRAQAISLELWEIVLITRKFILQL